MTNILCFGDSNTFGYNPQAAGLKENRFPRDKRWPGLLQTLLGGGYYVIEEGLGGRTNVFDDPTSAGRNGSDWLFPCLQTHQPLDLVVIMLGTNDTKVMYSAPVSEIARGLEILVQIVCNPFSTDRGVPPQVLVVSPILVGDDVGGSWLYGTFDETSVAKSKGLAEAYRKVADLYGCHFFDAATVANPADGEAIHLDESGHSALAEALAVKIKEIFAGL